MTRQEIFDVVARHLLLQGKKSQDRYRACRYRGSYGRMCAVGILIPDELYRDDLEGKGAANTVVVEVLIEAGVVDPEDHRHDVEQFLNALQGTHDAFLCRGWRDRLFDVANCWNLNTDVLKEFA